MTDWKDRPWMPVVRPPDYEAGLNAGAIGMARVHHPDARLAQGFSRISRPLPERLSLDLVEDAGDRLVMVNGLFVPEADHPQLWNIAVANLRSATRDPLMPVDLPGVYGGVWRDGFDAARAFLIPEITDGCAVRGTPLLFIPTTDCVFLTGSDDQVGIGAIVSAIERSLESGAHQSPYAFRDLLHGWPWTRANGELRKWDAYADHPLAYRMAALDRQCEQRRTAARALVADHNTAVGTAFGRPAHVRS